MSPDKSAATVRRPNDRARELIDEAVAEYADKWAAMVGSTATPQFRDDLTEALRACLGEHIAAGYDLYNRAAELRRDLDELAEAAALASKELHKVDSIMAGLQASGLSMMQHWPAFQAFVIHPPPLLVMACDLDGLVKEARRQASECKSIDRGGPTPMRAFTALVEGLLLAYRRATGKSGVGRSARGGQLLNLVTSVLTAARKIARAATDGSLRTPKSNKIGEFVYRVARRTRGE
jgi:hypothetical protein